LVLLYYFTYIDEARSNKNQVCIEQGVYSSKVYGGML